MFWGPRGVRRCTTLNPAYITSSSCIPTFPCIHWYFSCYNCAWISIAPSTVNGTDLGAQEWRDYLFLQCGIKPPYLPRHCDGCRIGFSISHALDCNKDGLVTSLHNELCDGVDNPSRKVLTSTRMHKDPVINPCHYVRSGKDFLAKSNPPNNLTGTAIEQK